MEKNFELKEGGSDNGSYIRVVCPSCNNLQEEKLKSGIVFGLDEIGYSCVKCSKEITIRASYKVVGEPNA